MQNPNLQAELETLEFQIDYKEKMLDTALKNDLKLGESKKLLHELKKLRERLAELNNQINKAS
jgi:predicted nuclease with TOPRIM domain